MNRWRTTKLRTRLLGIESGGKPVVTLSREDAEELDVRSGERVRLYYNNKEMTAIVNIMRSVPKGTVGIYDEIVRIWRVPEHQVIEVESTTFPESLHLIQNKLKRMKLNYEEILKILKDVAAGNLREAEIAAFVTALDQQGLDLDEATSLTVAMVETGKSLKLPDRDPVCDKHSIGGVPRRQDYPVISIKNNSSVEDAAQLMARKKLRHLLVDDTDKEVIGIITVTDLARYLKKNLADKELADSEVWELF